MQEIRRCTKKICLSTRKIGGFQSKKHGGMTMKVNIKKLAVSAMLTAVAVSLSGFSIPIGASKCFPVQHLANVLAGVFLGPW